MTQHQGSPCHVPENSKLRASQPQETLEQLPEQNETAEFMVTLYQYPLLYYALLRYYAYLHFGLLCVTCSPSERNNWPPAYKVRFYKVRMYTHCDQCIVLVLFCYLVFLVRYKILFLNQTRELLLN